MPLAIQGIHEQYFKISKMGISYVETFTLLIFKEPNMMALKMET